MKPLGLFKDDPTTLIETRDWRINYRIERDKSGPRTDCFCTENRELTIQLTLPFLSIWILGLKPMKRG